MNRITSINIKAALLLLVFSLNTIMGFACAIGLDMGYNPKHHQDEAEVEAASLHVHADGKKHDHHEQKESHDETHPHDAVNNPESEGNDSDNCCKEQVTKIAQLDKAIPHSLSIDPIFFTAYISTFYKIDVLGSSQVTKSTRYFVRSYHPPIPDILLAIQRFQI